MNQYKSSSELKNIAREKLSGKYGRSMLVAPVIPFALGFLTLFPLYMAIIIPYIFIMVFNNAEVTMESTIILFTILLLVTLVFQIVYSVFNIGINLFFLNIACGKRHSVSDIFFGFRRQFKKSLAFSAITILLNNLCTLPYQIFAFLMEFDPQPQWSIGAAISYIIALIIYAPIQLALSQYPYLLLDFPHYSVKELLKLSIRIMKGNKRRLLYIQLSFIPMILLCICSFSIGYLWLYPYILMTNSLFFLDLMKPDNKSASA